VLGHLEVHAGDGARALGGPKQRALLAYLILRGGEIVPTDQLVDALWGGSPPPTAAAIVHSYVRKLRAALAGTGATLETRSPGYRLELNGVGTDLALFEGLAAAGREALRNGEPARAAELLRQGLALWRGPALADLAHEPALEADRARFDQLRLEAILDRFDAELACGHGEELISELEPLVREHPFQERLRGQLMLALYRAGRQAEALELYRRTRELLRDELGLEPSKRLQDLERSILVHAPGLEGTRAELSAVAVCPFKGLAHFEVDDSPYFAGRERLVSDLVSRLVTTSLLGVVGASGAGKSSLLRAGLLPALAAGALPGSNEWDVRLMRPREHPSAELRRVLGGDDLPAAVAKLPEGKRLVVVVDQFEELFTTCGDEDERAAFVGALVDAVRDPDRSCIAVVALRADFYGQCADYPRFAELLSASHVLVGRMQRDELARAIEEPAARAGLRVERALVDALVADVADEPGGLPLLSTALLELWRLRDGAVLRLETYRSVGGVRRAVARLAESAYAGLTEAERPLARRLMLRLVAGEGEALVRRRVPLAELGLGRTPEAARVLEVLTSARLVTTSDQAVEIAHEALFQEWPRFRQWLDEDIEGRRRRAHLQASAREWEASGRDPGELYRGARLAAVLELGDLAELSELELEFVEASRAAHEREADRQRRENRRLRRLLASLALLLALATAAGTVALLQRQASQRRARIALARQLGAEAIVEPRIDRAMLLARESVNLDRSTATEGTLLATLLRSPAALSTFALPIVARPLTVAASPDGRTLAVSDNTGKLRVYDARTHRQTHPPLPDTGAVLLPEIYSRDGSLLLVQAYAGGRPLLELLSTRTLRPVRRLTFDRRYLDTPTGWAPGLALAPNGSRVFFTYDVLDKDGSDGMAYLDRWNTADGSRTTMPLGSTGMLGAGLTRDGRRLLTVTGSEIATWDVRTLRRLRTVRHTVPPASVPVAAVSPDGHTVAYGINTGSVSFVDARTGRTTPAASGGHTASVQYLAFSPNGRLVVTTSDDTKVIVWNAATGKRVQTLAGHGGRVTWAAFSADGTTLYSTSLDGAVFEWDLGRTRRFGRPFRFARPALPLPPGVTPTVPLALSPDGGTFAVRTSPLRIGLLSLSTLHRVRTLDLPRGAGRASAVAWSQDGGRIAVGTQAGQVRVWHVSQDLRRVHRLATRLSLRGFHGSVRAVAIAPNGRVLTALLNRYTADGGSARLAIWDADSGRLAARPVDLGRPSSSTVVFSPDGKLLATGRDDGTVLLLDPRSGRIRRTLKPIAGPSVSLAFERDGTLATGSWAGIVQRWNSSSGAELGRPVLVAAAPVASLSFDPSGRTFAETGGADGLLKLWNSSSPQQFGSTFPGNPGRWATTAFTPDGRNLLVVYDDGTGYLWPASVGAWEQHACAVAGRNLTRDEWRRFVPGHGYAKACVQAAA
jgi:WD40 repeat protein/DNA-binding SARP family transcriptional activator